MDTLIKSAPKQSPTALKYVYSFKEGDGKNKQLLGGKGANLCEMTQIGLNVPPGFVISTKACLDFLENASFTLPGGMMEEVIEQMKTVEIATGKIFGDHDNPLLVSVRSGSAMSMPGMMDTILNLGLNDRTLRGLIRQTGNERFCYDAYRRFIQLFGKVALGVPDEKFDQHFEEIKLKAGVKADIGLKTEWLPTLLIQLLSQPIKCIRLHLEIKFVRAGIELTGIGIGLANTGIMMLQTRVRIFHSGFSKEIIL